MSEGDAELTTLRANHNELEELLSLGGFPTTLYEALAGHTDKHVRRVLADNAWTPPAVLERLARDREPLVRLAVARSPRTPADTLAELAGDSDGSVRAEAAGNPELPAASMSRLATDRKFTVREALARNPAASAVILDQLVRRTPGPDEDSILLTVAEHRNVTAITLQRIVRHCSTPQFLPERRAANPNLTDGELAEPAASENPRVRAAVARNPSAPAAALAQLAKDREEAVRFNLLSNPAVSSELLDHLAEEHWELYSDAVLMALAVHPRTSPARLAVLLEAEAPEVRRRAAAHPATPARARAAYADRLVARALRSRAPLSRAVAAFWSATPEGTPATAAVPAKARGLVVGTTTDETLAPVLAELEARVLKSNDELLDEILALGSVSAPVVAALARVADPKVRRCVAKAAGTPPALLEALEADADPRVRANVAGNPATPPPVLGRLAADRRVVVRDAAARNPRTPPDALAKLLHDKDLGVQNAAGGNASTPPDALAAVRDVLVAAVASNESTPGEILLSMLDSESDNVRLKARTNPSLPDEGLRKVFFRAKGNLVAALGDHPRISPELVARAGGGAVTWQALYEQGCAGLCRNPATPPEILEKIGEDPVVSDLDYSYESIRQALAAHASATPALLERLLWDDNASVRLLALGNPALPADLRERYRRKRLSGWARRSAPLPRLLALLDPLVEADALEAAARSYEWLHRYAVAIHRATDPKVRTKLASNEHPDVAAAAGGR